MEADDVVRGTSPYGLSEAAAAKLLIEAVNRELLRHELKARQSQQPNADRSALMLFPKLVNKIPHRLAYICTEDGFFGLIFILIMVSQITLNICIANTSSSLNYFTLAESYKFDEFRWEYAAMMCIYTPFYLFTLWWYAASNKTESMRAFSHIREALKLYQYSYKRRFMGPSHHQGKRDNTEAKRASTSAQNLKKLYTVMEPPSEYDIPSCTFISVLRNAEWRRLPYNLVVEGDVIKLRFGDVAPCDLVQVVLVKNHKTYKGSVKLAHPTTGSQAVGDDATIEGSFFSETAEAEEASIYELKSTGRHFKKGTVFGLSDMHINPVASSLKSCPELSYAIFVVLQTPCVTQVHRYFSSNVYSGMKRRPNRTDTAFFEYVEVVYSTIIRPAMIAALAITTINVFIRTIVYYVLQKETVKRGAVLELSYLAVPLFPISSFWFFYSTPAYVIFPFLPLIPRLIISLTDLWGNARLQSLFLFHHERRYRCVPINENEGWSWNWLNSSRKSDPSRGGWRHSSVQSESDSTTSSFFSDTGLSRPSSADTAMSISRVPLSKQIQQIRNVFRQGLSGSSNLLHTLDSTTYLAFLDHSGLLIDTCRRVQEVCVVTSNGQIATQSERKYKAPFDQSSQAESAGSWHKLESSENNALASSGSEMDEMVEELRELRPLTLPIITTERDAGFHHNDSGNHAEWKSQESARGLRFVDTSEGSRYFPLLRPFTLAMKMTQVPPVFRVKGLSVAWLHTWRLHDFFQRDFFDVDDWQECLCELTTLTDMPRSLARFKVVRHLLAVDLAHGEEGLKRRRLAPVNTGLTVPSDGEPHDRSARWSTSSLLFPEDTPISISSSTDSLETPSTEAQHITIQDSPFFVDYLNFSDKQTLHVTMLALTKDTESSKLHLFSKSRPEAIITRAKWCYDGTGIKPINQRLSDKLEAVLVQWRSEGFDVFGFGYAPISPSHQTFLLHSLEEHTVVTTKTRRRMTTQTSTRRLLQLGKRRCNPDPTGSYVESEWKPLVCLPGPRSVALRPEPYVCRNELIMSETGLDSFDVQESNGLPETDQPVDHSAQMGVLRLLNYDNTIVSVRHVKKRPRLALTHSTPNLLKRGAEEVVGATVSSTGLDLDFKASWLPIKTAGLGASVLKRAWDEDMIFLGLVAIKNVTLKDVPERIADFHAAGVRVSIFSRLPIKQTRILGGILGLETGWNCLISLEENDKEAVYVNQDGNEVLPAGIPRIKRHLKEIDDIPLLVSLYANSTSPTTREMIRILEGSGEIVTCIGSALRTSNFDLFTEASCPISILLLPYPLCTDCHSRRNLGDYYNPILLPELSFSAALTSLPCVLQSHAVSFQILPLGSETTEESMTGAGEPYPSFLMQLLYSLFQEARRLVASIEQVVGFYVICSIGIMGTIIFIQNILVLPNLFSAYTAMCFEFLLLPWPSIALVCNPVRNSTMIEFPRTVSPEMKARRIRRRNIEETAPPGNASSYSSERDMSADWVQTDHVVEKESASAILLMCKTLIPIISTVFLSVWFLRNGVIKAAEDLKTQFAAESPGYAEILESSCLSRPASMWLTGLWTQCIYALGLSDFRSEERTYEVSTGAALIRETQCLTLLLSLAHCLVLSFTFVNRFESISLAPPWHNKELLLAWLATSVIAVLLLTIRLIAPYGNISWPPFSWGWTMLLILSLMASLAVAESMKHLEKVRHEKGQKFLRLLFQTRLGMWSPK